MKAVLMSIKPEFCSLIASGIKTIEVRKSKPRISAPFKVHIYCSDQNAKWENQFWVDKTHNKNAEPYLANGKVIGEFVCDGIYQISAHKTDEFHGNGFINCSDFGPYFGLDANKVLKDACLTGKQLLDYLGDNMTGFAWHISDLVIYDEPKLLIEFFTIDKAAIKECIFRHRDIINPDYTNGGILKGGYSCCQKQVEVNFCRPFENEDCKCVKNVFRPPQSWCYVEENYNG